MPVFAVDQDRLHPDRPRPLDVVVQRVPHHHRLAGVDLEQPEQRPEDRFVRLRLPVRVRRQHRVGDEPVMLDELGQVP